MSRVDDLIAIIGDTLDNRDNVRMLIEQVESLMSVVPFVGSGISIPLGFPSWSDFLKTQASKCGVEDKVSALLRTENYEQAAEVVYGARGNRAFQDAITSTYGSRHLVGRELKGAVLSLPFICTGPLITTNYDGVLEAAFDLSGHTFEEVVSGADADRFSRAIRLNRRSLLKIHGDAQTDKERILTKADYTRYYGGNDSQTFDDSLALPRLLKYLMMAHPLLFIGCSLSQDRTMAVLKAVSDENPSIAHYAIVECPPEETALYKRAYFLSVRNIRPIWYRHGEHEQVEAILKLLQDVYESTHRFDSSAPRDTTGAEPRPPKPKTALWAVDWLEADRAAAIKGLSRLQLPGQMEIRFSTVDPIGPFQHKQLLDAVRVSQIHTFGWPIAIYPDANPPQPTNDGIRLEFSQTTWGRTYDYWHLRQDGDFYQLEELYEDSGFSTTTVPGKAIFFNTRAVRVTEAILFLTRLYSRLGVADSTVVRFSVRHSGLKGRYVMAHPNSAAFPFALPKGPAHEEEATTEIERSVSSLRSDTARAVEMLLSRLFVMFDYYEVGASTYEKIVNEFIAGRVI